MIVNTSYKFICRYIAVVFLLLANSYSYSFNIRNNTTGIDTLSITDIAYANNEVFIFANGNVLIKSKDFGITWEKLIVELDRNIFFTQIVTLDSIILAYHFDFNFIISKNNGKDWFIDSTFSTLYENKKIERINNVIEFENKFIVSTDNGIFKYNLAYNKWEIVNFPFNCKYNMIFSANDKLFLNCDKGLFYSKNIVSNWKPINIDASIKKFPIWSLINDNDNLYFTNDSGVFFSSSLGSKLRNMTLNLEIPNSEYSGILSLFSYKKRIYLKSTFGIFYLDIANNNWQEILLEHHEKKHITHWVHLTTDDYLFLGNSHGDLYRSSDGHKFYRLL